MARKPEWASEQRPEFPEVMPPGFVMLSFANSEAVTFIVAEESLPALRRLFESQLWRSAAAPLIMVQVSDSLGNRWYWQSQG